MGKRDADKAKKDALSKKGDAPDLRKLNRVQLLRLLRDATEENERLSTELAATKERLDEAERKLEDRRIAIEDSESLAEASLRLTGMFAAAQHAIDLYGYNVALNTSKNVSGGGRSHSVGPAEDGREDQPSGGTLSPKSDEPGDDLDAE
ncbi:hypothetical protein [Parafannyhessea umbonata]|uniref:hypothetical protein n=1 Tax=Parafannyhessea umbonata TaxID=604330 RepID=UPI0018A6C131|nr:hypothetical protein [Parafannyhessea umbonata]